MDIILLIGRILLSLVFIVASLAKLADRTGSERAMVDFGVPIRLAAPLGILLPLIELVIAVALIPTGSAWWGALGALMLLLIFGAGISFNLARGRKPDCHCFGQLHNAPVGWPTLLRNSLLAIVAGFIVWQGGEEPGLSAIHWLVTLTPIQIVSLVSGVVILGALVIEGWLLLHLLHQNGRLLMRVEGLEAQLTLVNTMPVLAPVSSTSGLRLGSRAPAFDLRSVDGETLALNTLLALGRPVLLIFSDPSCGPCNALLPDIARWQQDYISIVTIALISRGSVEINRIKASENIILNVLLQNDQEVALMYQAYGTPAAILIHPDGTIGSLLAMGAEAINTLVRRVGDIRLLISTPG